MASALLVIDVQNEAAHGPTHGSGGWALASDEIDFPSPVPLA